MSYVLADVCPPMSYVLGSTEPGLLLLATKSLGSTNLASDRLTPGTNRVADPPDPTRNLVTPVDHAAATP